MLDAYIQLILKRRWTVMLLAVVVCLIAGAGLKELDFSSDYRDFFRANNPRLQAFEELQETYARSNNLFVAVTTGDKTVFTRNTLGSIKALTDGAWRLPYVSRVDSLTNFQHVGSTENALVVRDLVINPANLTDAELVELAEIARGEQHLVGMLLSSDLTVTGINLSISSEGLTDTGKPALVEALGGLLTQIQEQNPLLQFYVTGSVLVDHSFDVEAGRDLLVLYPAMYVVVVIFTILVTRSVTATIGTLLVITLAWILSLGTIGWVGIKLTAISVAAPTVLMTLAVAHCTHVIMGVRDAMAERLGKSKAIARSLRDNFKPFLLTTTTDVIGFLAMTASEVPPLVDLGIIVSMGVVGVYILSLSFLPAFLATFPYRPPHKPSRANPLHCLARLTARHYRGVIVFWVVLTAGCAAFVGQNEINDNFIEYFSEDVPVRQDTQFITKRLTGVHQLHYSIGAGEKQGIFEPTYLAQVDGFAEWLRGQPGVRHVYSMSDIIKRLNQEMNGGDPAAYSLPESRKLAAQYFLVYEMSLPFGLDTTDRVDLQKSATRLTATIDDLSSREILELDRRAQAWLATNADPALATRGTGATIMFADIGLRNANSLVSGGIVALLLISAIIVAGLRSIRLGLLSLVPNLLPALLAFGVWGLIDGEVGLAVSIVTMMTFGIVVDDTIHFMTAYCAERKAGTLSAERAIARTFDKVGKALIGTSVILAAGFLVLTLSAFRLNASMGLLTSIVIIFALMTDLLLLPALLLVFDRVKAGPQRSAAATDGATVARLPAW